MPMEHPTSALLMWAIFLPCITGVLTLWLPRKALERRVWLAASGPALAFLLTLRHVAQYGIAGAGGSGAELVGTSVIPWADIVHLNFTFLADGLGVFFALLVSGIGLLIVLYGRAYFGQDKDDNYRFFPTLGFFTTAMIGIVLSDSMLLTLLFWEMTSISSFLLIGWDRYDQVAVKKAMQAFFTTGLGGMAILGGVVLFGGETGIWRWSDLINHFTMEGAAPLPVNWYTTSSYILFAIGAGTKSAQYPFHYWLPGAMLAPTPVSTFLHSATMVKAGIFLTARLYPVFHGLPIWPWVLLIPGAITMLYGGILALNQHDLKRIFAYTTVSQLGLLMCVYGLGAFEYLHGGSGEHAAGAAHGMVASIDWDITQIANHAFYKAPLFILAGAIGHVAGTRNLPELFGFVKRHRIMAILLILAAYALAGGPGTISFPAKELFFYSIYHAFETHWIFKVLAIMAVLTAVCNVAIFMRILTTMMGWKFGMRTPEPIAAETHGSAHDHPHDTRFWTAMLWIPAAIIVFWQYLGGLLPPVWNSMFMPLEANINYPGFEHGMPFFWQVHWGIPLIMSMCAIAIGVLVGIGPFMRGAVVDPHDEIYPGMYWLSVTGGGQAFGLLQTGNFRHYVIMVLGALIIGFVGTLYIDPSMVNVDFSSTFEFWPAVFLGIIICASAIMMPMVQARVIRVLVLGTCGFSVVGMYLVLQAPDLALTQVMFELISVILFVIVLRLLPKVDTKKRPNRFIRLAIGCSVGLIFGWMTLLAAQSPSSHALGHFFEANSHYGTAATGMRGGGGKNIVNVVLVDFRGFDTLGEITVLSLAALAVWSLLPRVRNVIHAGAERLTFSGGGGGGTPAMGAGPMRSPDGSGGQEEVNS